MRRDLGVIKASDGRTFSAFWNRQTKRVYVRPTRSALLSAFSNAGIAYSEEEAQVVARSYVLNTLFHWA